VDKGPTSFVVVSVVTTSLTAAGTTSFWEAGRGGNDILHGTGGSDLLDGGAGTDECVDRETVLSCEA
jgi:Ca2+-binding RTX toxin-like protein